MLLLHGSRSRESHRKKNSLASLMKTRLSGIHRFDAFSLDSSFANSGHNDSSNGMDVNKSRFAYFIFHHIFLFAYSVCLHLSPSVILMHAECLPVHKNIR